MTDMGLILPKISRRSLLKAGVGLFVPCAPAIIRPARAGLTVNQLSGFNSFQQAAGGSIEFVGGASRTGAGTISLTALTGGIDTTAQTGDLVICAIGANNTSDLDVAIATPTGFAEIVDIYYNGSFNDINLGVFRKEMGGTPDTSVTIPNYSSEVAAVYVLRGHDSATPEDATATTGTGVFSVPNNPSITTVTANAMVLAIYTRGTSEATTTAPSGYSDLVKETTTNIQVGIANRVVASPGAENPPIWENATDGSLVAYATATVAIRAA